MAGIRMRASTIIALLTVLAGSSRGFAADVTVIKAKRIHTVSGSPIDNGVLILRDGRIEAVGTDIDVPEGARVIELTGSIVTPGLVDASCELDFEIPQNPVRFRGRRASSASQSWAEHSSEVIPHRLVFDSVNLLSNDFERLLKGGVTTVYVSPDSASVIGTRGAIVKTGGPLERRVVRRADAVKATMGGDPSRRGRSNNLPPWYGPPPTFHTRRPTTRMGVDFVFRKAFYDTLRDEKGLPVSGADTPPAEAFPVLRQILDGTIPLRIQARTQHDIFSALRLANEFGLQFTLEEAIEAYQCLPQLKASDVPVIFGPIYITPTGYRARTGEARDPRLNSAKQLFDAGIRFALTAHELRDEEGLARQAMFAVRYGLPEREALKAVTAAPAALMGLSDRLGTLEPGKAADLVVWSTEPFDAFSRVLMVMIDGQVVYEE